MTNSKARRSYMLVRNIPTEELGPNFFSNLKTGLKEYYNLEMKSFLNLMVDMHNIISKKNPLEDGKVLDEVEIQKLVRMQIQLDRNSLIEGIIILDSYINQALNHFQLRILQKNQESIINYEKVEEGLNEYLKNITLPEGFEYLRNKMKHFRTLRNQFAHYPYGTFSFPAKSESFEGFLKSMNGIELQESLWTNDQGKAGVYIPYTFSSGQFIENFYFESLKFFEMLVDILFPNEKIN